MFFLYALLSMLGFALQQVLLTRYARSMDGLSLAFYRNVSFLITFLPLLFFAPVGEIVAVLRFWPLLLLSGLCGGFYLSFLYTALRFLPIGFASAISRGAQATLLTASGWFLFGEVLSFPILFFILCIIISIVWLGSYRHVFDHLDVRSGMGVLFLLCGSIFHTINGLTITILAREGGPLAAAYFWEISIALGALLILVVRKFLFGTGAARVTVRRFCGITLVSLPTLIGTVFFALAVRSGPVGIVGAVSASSTAMMTLLGHFFFREKLTFRQWLAILAVSAGVAGLGLV